MGRVKLPPAPVRGALAEAVHLARAFLVTVSGRDPTSLGTSTPNLAGGLRSVDFGVFALYALLLFAANWALRLAVIEPCARRALTARGRAPSASTVQKFAQAATEFFIYALFAFFGAMIVPSQPFAWPSANWWIGFSDGSHSVMRDDMRCYYVLYASRYAQAALSVLLEHKRKDFVEMQVHHSVTVALVGISYAYGWNRIGVIVMLLLDPADVPLHLAKMSKYMHDARVPPGGEAAPGSAAASWMFAADRLFELFALTFFVTRLVLYPYACWSAHIEATRYFPKGAPEWACVALLETLLALQVYWFWLILKVAIKLITTGKVEDVRSDSEDEADAPKKKTK